MSNRVAPCLSVEKANPSEDGFTLVEMLVALAVLAVMGGLMAGFLTQLSSVNRFEAEIAKQTELDAAAGYLQRVFRTIKPVKLLDAEPNTNPLFEGKSSSVRAALITRQGIYSLGLRDVNIYIEERDGKRNLVHTLAPRRTVNGEPVLPTGAPVPIVDDIDSVAFEFSDNSSWSNSFSSDGKLPSAIKVTLKAKVGKKELEATAISFSN